MGAALVVLEGHAVDPGATITAITMDSGDSLTVANFNPASSAYLATLWSPGATAGIARVRSPRMHDQVQGIRLQRSAGDRKHLLTPTNTQPLYPGDLLVAELSGGGSETDMLALLLYYLDMPGVAARLQDYATTQPHINNIAGVEVDCTAGATAGTYGAGVALNASFDTLKAGVDYALLGYTSSVAGGTFAIAGPDTGNLKVGGPLALDSVYTREWFVKLSQALGLPCIPIVNANNKGSTNVYVSDVAANTAINVSLILAELGA